MLIIDYAHRHRLCTTKRANGRRKGHGHGHEHGTGAGSLVRFVTRLEIRAKTALQCNCKWTQTFGRERPGA